MYLESYSFSILCDPIFGWGVSSVRSRPKTLWFKAKFQKYPDPKSPPGNRFLLTSDKRCNKSPYRSPKCIFRSLPFIVCQHLEPNIVAIHCWCETAHCVVPWHVCAQLPRLSFYDALTGTMHRKGWKRGRQTHGFSMCVICQKRLWSAENDGEQNKVAEDQTAMQKPSNSYHCLHWTFTERKDIK